MDKYLLTSEFVNGETPDQLRKSLFKFRNEYRKLSSFTESLNRRITVKDDKISKLKKDNKELNDKLKKANEELSKLYEKTNKKLTLKERFLGKININK
jgi:chromosome segregation ATPase